LTKVPSLSYIEVVRALERAGFSIVRQRGSHIRMERVTGETTIKLTVPAHKPIKRSTLSHILKAADLTVDDLLSLL
jgi:predicted RNA binding protein YcfA (HicA-like mRNA interferase family)